MENNALNTAAAQFDLNLLVSLTQELTRLVNTECDLLKEMRIQDTKQIQSQKNAVASKLEKQQNLLRENPKLRAALSAEEKLLLREVATEFDSAIQSYQDHLFKAQKVNEFILNKMVEVVTEHVEKSRAYNRKGLKLASGMELAKNTPAIKFNAQV